MRMKMTLHLLALMLLSAPTVQAEALRIMNMPDRPITSLFVVEAARPLGIVHIHDCLRAGVA